MADKRLKIEAALTVKTSEAERTLKKLEKEGVRISTILKGLDINTRGGRAGFAKQLATANKEMLKLRGTTGDTARAMEHLWGRQIEKQTKSLDNYTRKIERLNRIFKVHKTNVDFQTEVGNTAMAAQAKARADRAAAAIAVAEAGRQGTAANLKDLQSQNGDQGRRRDAAIYASAIGQAVSSALGQGAGIYQMGKTALAQNMAVAGSFHGGMLRRIASGNYQDAALLARNGGAGIGFLNDTAGTGASSVQAGMSAAGQVLSTAKNALMVAGGGAVGGAAAAGSGAMTDTQNNVRVAADSSSGLMGAASNLMNSQYYGGKYAQEANTMNQGLAAGRSIDPYFQMRMENLQATAGGRLAASRRLGNRHQALAGFGAGYGFTQDQAFGLGTGLADQFGGGAGLAAAKSGMAHATQGFDAGTMGNIVGTINMAQGGKGGEEAMSRIIGRGTKQGMEQLNIQFFEKFGEAVANNAFGHGGNTHGQGNFSEALMFGMNKKSTMADVQANISGEQALDNTMHNNPFFRATGMGMASKILGKGASGLKISALQNASIAQLVRGSDELSALGITEGQRKRLLSGQMDAVTRSMLNDKSPEGRFLLDGAKKAGGMTQFLAHSKHGRELMASTLTESGLGFNDYKTAMGAVNFMAGTTSGKDKGGKFGAMQDETAFTQIQTQAKVMHQIWADEAKVRQQLVDAMHKSLESFDKLKEIPAGLDAAEKAVDALNDVYGALALIAGVGPQAAQNIIKQGGTGARGEGRSTFDSGTHGSNNDHAGGLHKVN